ncbi:MAG: DMT family transporter [Albidovulum sp.]|nr:DMT family transporter [Albidovulum sp.]MDE0307844.1 DMT family transporter [Albidovulum sp.]MDE0533604.1 DMT family transporter [Albidovulum sp.]
MSKESAVLLVILGAVFMSFVGIFIRLIDNSDGFQILLYRSISLCAMLALLICVRRRISPYRLIRSFDANDVAIGLALSVAFTTYVFAILNTSVASALFILTASPFLAALLAYAWIGEVPHPFTWVAIAVAAFGVFLMLGEGLSNGRTFGNIMALISASAFAVMLVVARKGGKIDILGGAFLGGFLAAAYGLVLSIFVGKGLIVERDDLIFMLAMGSFSIGLGIGLVTWATPYIPAAEVSVLVLIESVLAPVWVWAFNFEQITFVEFIGGSIVFSAIVALSIVSTRRRSLRGPFGFR